MERKEITEAERGAYWLGVGHVLTFAVLVVGVIATLYWGTNSDADGRSASTIVPTAQASEPEGKDLFALNAPADACPYEDGLIAWQRDETFTTRLRIFCVEDSEVAEGDNIVVWSQTGNQPFAARHVIQEGFYSHKVLWGDDARQPYLDACGGDGFLGWSRSPSYLIGGDVSTPQVNDRDRIVSFSGGRLWCLGDDLYVLRNPTGHDDNLPDRRFDVAKGVEMFWMP